MLRFLKTALLVVAIHLVAVAGAQEAGGDLTIGIRFDSFGTLDIHVTPLTQTAYVAGHIFEKLIYLDQDGNLLPWLATSWESNDDATVWTLALRDDVTFHDGTPFNADAVVANFERMVDPETNSRTAGPLLGSYESSEAIDEFTVQVNFSEPYAQFAFALSSPFVGMVSPTAVETYGDAFDEHLIGTGPFKFVSQEPQIEVVLERNEDYAWGPEVFQDGPAYLDTVTFKLILEEETRLAALQTGEAQIVDEIPATRVASIRDAGQFELLGAPRLGIARSNFLNAMLPPTDDVRIRRAINHAVDVEAINQAIFRGVYPMAKQVLTEGVRFYDPAYENTYPYDPERAVELLEEAGWTEINSDGYRVKDGEELFINHATFAGYVAEAPSELVQAYLRDIGVRMDITVVGSGYVDVVSAIDSPYHSAHVATYSPDPGLILDRVFHSDGIGSANWGHYANDELDQLLEAGLATSDEEERAEIYSEIQRIFAEDAVALPLYANVSIFGFGPEVEGLRFNAYAHPELLGVWLND
jgi:peptide/nickel transport system substrate-binding protein